MKKIILVGNRIIPDWTRAWIVNHLGRNPKNGGIPLSERKFRIKNIFVMILEFIVWKSWFK